MTDLVQPPLPALQFIDWSAPFLPSFINQLMLNGGTDLAEKIIVVPTAESGRRLRHALAKQGCALVPKVVTPQFFLAQYNSGQEMASLYAWVQVLLDLDLDQARGLFPKDPPDGVSKSFRWAFNVGRQLHDLQSTLSDSNKDFSEVGRMSAGGLDGDRWADLAILGEQVEQTMRSWKVVENPEYNLINSNADIIIAAVTDIATVVTDRLSLLIQNGASVTVVTHGDKNMPHGFDHWGRPVPSVWIEEEIPYPNWQENILICENPSLLGQQLVKKISANQWNPKDITLGLCDRELKASVSRDLTQAGWSTYDPEGKQIKASSFMQFLRALRSWLEDERPLRALIDLLHLPQMEGFLKESGPKRQALLNQIEPLMAKRIAMSSIDLIDYLKSLSEPPAVLSFLESFLEETTQLFSGSAIKGLRGWLAKALNRTPQNAASAIVDDISDMLEALEKIEKKTKKVSLVQALDILCELLSHKKMYSDPTGTMIDLKGWIELTYEDAEDIVLLGLHEGVVPSTTGDDPFLPDSMREILGIETSRDQYARDCYLFRSLIESRKNVHVFLTKLNESNAPNKASRLLMQTSGQDLAERVQRFFGPADIEPENPSAWQRDWSLNLPEVHNPYSIENGAIPRMLSPTALKDYLHCPLRFFFTRVMRLERFTPDKSEMDALDFGNLIHAVVEKFGLDETIRDSISETEIKAAFEKILASEVFNRFGKNLTLGMQMQVQIASKRLRALAKHQAEERAAGWKIIDVELLVGEDLQWQIADHPITMMLDRVDRHEQTGEIRVWDYKTGKKEDPEKAHIVNYKAEQNKPIAAELLTIKKKEKRWKNLQLPLYAWFAQHHYGCEDIPTVGYISLPKSISDTGFTTWQSFDQERLNSAKLWAEGTIRRIQNSEFFTPALLDTKEQEWDPYAKLAQGDISKAFGLTPNV